MKQFVEFSFPVRVKLLHRSIISAVAAYYHHHIWWRKNSQCRHSVGCVQVKTPGCAGINKETSSEQSAEFRELWFSVHPNCEKYFLLYAKRIIWIAAYRMSIPFPHVSLPNYVYFLGKMGLILAYDFEDELATASAAFSPFRLNCFINSLRCFPESVSFFATKWDGLLLAWRNNLPTLHMSQAVLCKCSVIGTFIVYPNKLCKMHQYAFPFFVIHLLKCPSLQIF